LAEAELAQFHTLYEEKEMNLLRKNDAPMSLNLALPPISIPEFNGEYLDWPRFHDLFVELVHNKPYSVSQKLHVLQSSLHGEARNVLTDTAFSQGGYDDTLLRLKARYQNGKILVFAAIAKIVDLKPIDGLSRQLRTLHDKVKNSMSTLRNLEISTKSWDPIIGFLMRRKLNQYTLAAFEDSANSPTLAIVTRDQPLQAMDASGPNQQIPLINKVSAFALEQQPNMYVLLAAAIVAVQGQTGKRENCRAIVDLGSQLNLMFRRMADQLALPTFSISQGVGQQAQGSSSRARVLLSSLRSKFQKEIDVFILRQLTKNQPSDSDTHD